jgi:hypothetical protein
MQWNDTNIIVVKAFIGKLCLRVRKLEGVSLDICSRMMDFVDKNSVEIGDTAIKYHLVNLQARFSIFHQQ